MDARSSLTEQQREELVLLFEQGWGNQSAASRLGVARDPVRRLERRWRLHGRLCLVEKTTKASYSFLVKKEVVERFLAGESKMDLAREFDLSSDQIVTRWVRQWHQGGDDALTPQPKGRPRKTNSPSHLTEEERLRRQVAALEAENAYLKKLRDLRSQGHG